MLDYLAELFKTLWIPGSAAFFVFGLILISILTFSDRRLAPWGRRLLLSLTILGYLLSTPMVASSMVDLLSRGYMPLEPGVVPLDVNAIVILGGGGATYRFGAHQIDSMSSPTSLRLLEGLRLFEELSMDWIIVSGGTNDRAGVATAESETMAASLVELGVPANQILIERMSSNTRDQVLNIPPILEQKDIGGFILVTSPTHMRRASLSFKAEGLEHLASTAPLISDTKPALGLSPLPSAEALETSKDVFRELVGLLYYFLRGWI